MFSYYRMCSLTIEWQIDDSMLPRYRYACMHVHVRVHAGGRVRTAAIGQNKKRQLLQLAIDIIHACIHAHTHTHTHTHAHTHTQLYDGQKKEFVKLSIDDYLPTDNGRPLFAKPNGSVPLYI